MAEMDDNTQDQEMDTQAPAQEPVAAETPAQDVQQPAAVPDASQSFINPAPISPTPTAQEMNAHDDDFHQALQQGAITPEKYPDLLANKSTAGKIMTLFGLMVSGAGSGLSHQPNLLMDMMNKEIDRDLEAQKQTKANAMNMWNLNYQHQLQQLQARQIAAGIPLTQANTELAKQQAAIAAQTAAKNKITLDMLNRLQNASANSPAAQATLNNIIAPAVIQGNNQRNQQTAAQLQTVGALGGQQPQNPTNIDSGVDLNKLNKMQVAGSLLHGQGVPVDPSQGIDPAELGKVREEQGKVQQNRENLKNYSTIFNKLDAAHAAGRLNPADRQALITPLMDQMGYQLGLGQEGTKELATSLFPEATDWGATRNDKFKQGLQHFKVLEQNTPTLDSYGLKTPFPNLGLGQGAQKQGSSTPVERITSDGKTALFDPNTKKFLGYK